jgi:hypothetical protein
MVRERAGKFVIVGKGRGQIRAESMRRAGERREVDDQVPLGLVGECERVGEDQGVGIADLDAFVLDLSSSAACLRLS